jgi:hypothetical protein
MSAHRVSRRRRLTVLPGLVVVVSIGGLGGCAIGGFGPGPSGSASPVPSVSTGAAGVGQRTAGAHTAAGEIWRWGLGRAWDDPLIAPYTKDFGHPREWGDNQAGHVHSEGFQLDLDAGGHVRAVTVFADEASLGLGSGYSQFTGRLPLGLTWSTTATEAYRALGEPRSITGGFGFDVEWVYLADELRVRLFFRHGSGAPGGLSPTAPLHCITVEPA